MTLIVDLESRHTFTYKHSFSKVWVHDFYLKSINFVHGHFLNPKSFCLLSRNHIKEEIWFKQELFTEGCYCDLDPQKNQWFKVTAHPFTKRYFVVEVWPRLRSGVENYARTSGVERVYGVRYYSVWDANTAGSKWSHWKGQGRKFIISLYCSHPLWLFLNFFFH